MKHFRIRVHAIFEKLLVFEPSFKDDNRSSELVVLLGLLTTWITIVATVALQHELWRDEVRALSIVSGVDSPLEIINALKDEGHPALWYFILYVGYTITHSNFILQGISIGIAFLAVSVFLFRAPFPLWLKAMFVFSFFPIYEYSVMARNYGISMLLFFAYASIYDKRRDHPLFLGLLLALLANTNVHSLMLSCILAAIWLWDEFIIYPGGSLKSRLTTCGTGFLLTVLGVIISVVTIWPEHSTIQTPVKLSLYEIFSTLTLNSIFPAKKFSAILPFSYESILNSIMVWILVIGLSSRLHLSIALLAGYALIGTFSDLVYPMGPRHLGVVFAFTICLYWIAQRERKSQTDSPRASSIPNKLAYLASIFVILPIIMGCHVYKGYNAIVLDVHEQKSSTASLGQFLNSHQELHDAIIMAEPDFDIEALPYYSPNRIYLPRESKFGKTYNLTTASKATLSLGELLEMARMLRKAEQKPVLIALGIGYINIDDSEHAEIRYHATKRIFKWSVKELADFHSSTRVVAKFLAAKDENYILYQLN